MENMEGIKEFAKNLNNYSTAVGVILAFVTVVFIPFVIWLFKKKKIFSPNISATKQTERNGMYKQVLLQNIGNEPLVDLKVTRNDGVVIENFYDVGEKQISDYPHTVTGLDVNERKIATGFPDQVTINIIAKGVKSHKDFKKTFSFSFR
jgi:hypothetical protein